MLIYRLFGLIDYVIFEAASLLFSLIMDIASFDLFKESVISDFGTKIYGILAVIMTFKIILSCIQYLLNPDKIADKEAGMGGLLKNTAITIILLMFIPNIFGFAKAIQSEAVELIPEFILGVKMGKSDGDGTTSAKTIGEKLAFNTLKAFITVKNKGTDEIKNFSQFNDHIVDDCMPSGGWIWDKFEYLFSSEKCHYKYRVIIPSIAGAFMVYILLGMVIDIGVRAVKFGMLELIAPLPIASYMDKKTKSHFDAWLKTCKDVYLDLFIRLIIIYFVLYLLDVVDFHSLFTQDGETAGTPGWLLGTAIVFAILVFAKDAPKFITGMLGLKDTGSMKDMFQPFWKKGGGAAAALVNPFRNAAGNAAAAMANTKGTGMSTGRRLANALRHGATGAVAGAAGGLVGAAKGENWSQMGQRLTKSVQKSSKRSAQEGIRALDKKETNETRDVANEAKTKIMDAKAERERLTQEQNRKDASALQTFDKDIDTALQKVKDDAVTAFSNNKTLTAERDSLANEIAQMERDHKPAADIAAKKAELANKDQLIASNNAKIEEYKKIKDGMDQKAAIDQEYDKKITAIDSDTSLSADEKDRQKNAINTERKAAYQKADKYRDLRLGVARRKDQENNSKAELETEKNRYAQTIKEKTDILNDSNRDFVDKEIAQAELLDAQSHLDAITNTNGSIKQSAIEERAAINAGIELATYGDKLQAQQSIINQSVADVKTATGGSVTLTSDDIENIEKFDTKKEIKRVLPGKISDGARRVWEEKVLMKEGITGQTYSDLATTITSARKDWWSGEAMTKLKQNPSILENSGSTSLFKPAQKALVGDHRAEDFTFTFSEITDLKTRVERDPRELDTINAERRAAGKVEFATVDEIKEGIYNEVLKFAAVEYVDRVDNGTLVGGNAGMTEAIKRFRASVSTSRCPEAKNYDIGPGNLGKFLMGGADTGASLQTRAARMNSYRSGKKENK